MVCILEIQNLWFAETLSQEISVPFTFIFYSTRRNIFVKWKSEPPTRSLRDLRTVLKAVDHATDDWPCSQKKLLQVLYNR